MFIINTFSTYFEHHYAHLQENKTCVTACGVLRWFCWMRFVAVVGRCVVGCEQCGIWINSSETQSEVVAGTLASRNDRMCWDRLISRIHDNPVEIEVHLIARISSQCVNVQKFARYICARKQRTVCVTSSITIKSQARGSTAFVYYSTIFPLKFTTINVF